jgi:hypothetical protein
MTKSPSSLNDLLPFALALIILNLDKPIKLKDRTLHSKRNNFYNL